LPSEEKKGKESARKRVETGGGGKSSEEEKNSIGSRKAKARGSESEAKAKKSGKRRRKKTHNSFQKARRILVFPRKTALACARLRRWDDVPCVLGSAASPLDTWQEAKSKKQKEKEADDSADDDVNEKKRKKERRELNREKVGFSSLCCYSSCASSSLCDRRAL
jgi:hypothetical protein